ncbi:MAG: GIY-YIG nuclease family protein [Rhodobacteraceae bacterium]|nr:MAG: GIY-YIG nuclease family protein [Paracoccaceae bacterium]
MAGPRLRYVVYRLTFPNGRIYIGKDIGGRGHSLRYFGSWDNTTVSADFSDQELRDFTVRKEILFESADKYEVTRKESELIRENRSNVSEIGYNRTHRKKTSSVDSGFRRVDDEDQK